MVFALIPLLLAQVVCVDNRDGTWTCSGYYPPGIETNSQGQASCTNCVNMSPATCQFLKSQLISGVLETEQAFSSIISQADQIKNQCRLDYSQFTDWPYEGYTPDPSTVDWEGSLFYLVTGSSSPLATNRIVFCQRLASYYNSSPQVVSGYVPRCPDPPSSPTIAIARQYAVYVYSFWHGSYLVAQDALSAFQRIYSDADNVRRLALSGGDSLASIKTAANAITCGVCSLAGGDSGGGSGVDQGCRECYLVFLRKFEEQFEHMKDQLDFISSAVSNVEEITANGFSRLDVQLSVISNAVQRIDDYLWTDQSNMLANVESAIIVISNNIDSIQSYYYHTFSNASDISSGSYGKQSPSMEEVFNSIFKPKDQGGFRLEEYQKYDWFRRIELQLSQISGIFSETNVESLSDSDYNSMKDAVENFEDLSDGVTSSGGSVVSVGSSLRSAAQTIGSIFPSSAPSGEITLLEARYWIGDTDLVLRIDFQVVSFCRALFGLIWVTLACVGLWLLLSRSWVVHYDIARWFCNWFPKIFGN